MQQREPPPSEKSVKSWQSGKLALPPKKKPAWWREQTNIPTNFGMDKHTHTHARTRQAGEPREEFIVIPVSALRRARGLTGNQYDLWLYLFERDKYGAGRSIPGPEEIGQELGQSDRSVRRNAQELEDKGLFAFRVEKWKGKNLGAKNSFGKDIPTPDKFVRIRTNLSGSGQICPECQNGIIPETPVNTGSPGDATHPKQCTNNRSNRSFKTKTIGTSTPTQPTPHPVSGEADAHSAIDRGVLPGMPEPLTTELLEAITAVGVRVNKTIQTALLELLKTGECSAVRRAVENACSALREQRSKSVIKNPGGFFVAALRRGFTANEAKKEMRRQAAPPPSFNEVSATINQAIARNDRGWALARLQALWREGYHDMIEELCLVWKRDWRFSVTSDGIADLGGER